MARELLAAGADPNVQTNVRLLLKALLVFVYSQCHFQFGSTALMGACTNKHYATAILLLEFGADIYLRNQVSTLN